MNPAPPGADPGHRRLGGQLSLHAGRNEKVNDGKNRDFSLSYGAGSEKATLMFGLSHSESGAVFARDRESTRYARGPNFPLEKLGAGPWGRIRQVTAAGNATGFDKILNHTGARASRPTWPATRPPAATPCARLMPS